MPDDSAVVTVRVLCQRLGLLVWERCRDATHLVPGTRGYDAVEVSLRELFVLQSPPTVTKAPWGRWVETRARLEVSVFGLTVRSFDRLVRTPFDSWVRKTHLKLVFDSF